MRYIFCSSGREVEKRLVICWEPIMNNDTVLYKSATAIVFAINCDEKMCFIVIFVVCEFTVKLV